jgi:hypothetical protein
MVRLCTCLFGNTIVDEKENDPKTVVEVEQDPNEDDAESSLISEEEEDSIENDADSVVVSQEGGPKTVVEQQDPTEDDAEAITRSSDQEWLQTPSSHETYGVHYSIIEDILASIPDSIDMSTATTSTIIAEVVKTHPKLMSMKVSWLDMLRDENALTASGLPMAGKATAMISHTWRYNFNDTAETIIAFAKDHEATNNEPVYIWMDMFNLNQFATESFDANWLKDTFTTVIKDIGLTVSIMTPFEDPATIKRVWCLWELYLSTRYSKLHIALPPDQTIRFQDALLTDPYSVTQLMEQIDGIKAENAEAFDPNDKEMIFKEIEASIGFAELNHVVVTSLRQWIEEQCQKKVDAIKSGTLDANSAMAAPTTHNGSGSTLFRAITLRSTGLVKLSLLHPDVDKVVNGTSDSWPPFANALSMGLIDIADELMDHKAFNLSQAHWQIDSYMIAEKNGHSYHPDFDTRVPHSRVVKTLRKFFDMRVEAGHTEFTDYDDFVKQSKEGTLPSGWCY